MKACYMDDFGGPEVLRVREISCPPKMPQHGALVIIHALSINPFDCAIRRNYRSNLQSKLPIVLGLDIAGIVTAVSPGSKLKVGQRVCGYVDPRRMGGYADLVAIAPDEVMSVPSAIDFTEAAAMPVAGITAMEALSGLSHLTKGSTVLLTGAAGGVGTYLVQLLKMFGFCVVAIASPYNFSYLKSLGADRCIDYNTVPFEKIDHRYDAVITGLPPSFLTATYPLVKPGGVLVSMKAPLNEDKLRAWRISGNYVYALPNIRALKTIGALIADQKIKTTVKVYDGLESIPAIHREMEGGHATGKRVVVVRR